MSSGAVPSRGARTPNLVENGCTAQLSSQDTMNVFYFIIAFVIFIGGIALFAFAFDVPQFQALMFLGGIAAICVALAIPFHILGHGEQR